VTGLCAWAFPSLRKPTASCRPNGEILATAGSKDMPDIEIPAMAAGPAEKG